MDMETVLIDEQYCSVTPDPTGNTFLNVTVDFVPFSHNVRKEGISSY